MDDFEDYVVISHNDIPQDEQARAAAAPSESRQQHRVHDKATAPEQHPRPFTRAYINHIHAIQDKWAASKVVNHRSSGTIRHTSLAYLGEISAYVDSLADALWPVNKTIHDNPELGFKEYIAHDALTKFMQSQEGWRVQSSAYGMETAWIAVYDSGKKGPVVSFNAEMGMPTLDKSPGHSSWPLLDMKNTYNIWRFLADIVQDALVGIGHACGHNLIATVSVAAAVATAHTMAQHSLPGKVVLFGTPAEEGGGGKIKLIQAGAFRDHKVDISLMSHPGITADCALERTTAFTRFKVEYFGKEAHAAANPWLGTNALDALITAYNAMSMLRQQTMPGDIIQGYIMNGGIASNIIHAYAAGEFSVRAETLGRLKELRPKVDACFEAGTMATGAKLKVTEMQGYADHVPNRVLGRTYTKYWNELVPSKENPYEPPTSKIPLDQDIDEQRGITRASTDQGDVSYAMPSLHVGFSLTPGPQGQGPHNPEFAEVAGKRDAFDRCLRVAKALAGTALEVLTRQGLVEEVKEAWKEDMRKSGKPV